MTVNDIPGIASDLFGWLTPLVGLAISFVAWRRYRAPGISLAVAAFSLMLIGPVTGLMVRQMLQGDSGLKATDVSVIFLVIGLFSAIGGILLIVAMRRLIRAACEASASSIHFPEIDRE